MGWEAPPPSSGGLGGTTNGELFSSAGCASQSIAAESTRGTGSTSCGNLPLTSRLGDDGVPYLLHVRDHASSLLELPSMAPEHVHGHTFLRLPQKSCMWCKLERLAHQTSPHRQPAWRDRVKCRDHLVCGPILERNQMTSCVRACSQNCLLAPMHVANLRLVFQEQRSHDVLPGLLARGRAPSHIWRYQVTENGSLQCAE